MDTLHATHTSRPATKRGERVWRGVAATLALAVVLPSLCLADDPPQKPAAAQVSDALNAKGGAAFTVKVLSPDGQPVTDEMVAASAGIVEKRINPDGKRSLTLKTKGDLVLVEVPGLTEKETKALAVLLEKRAVLEFRVLPPEGREYTSKEGTTEKPGYVKMKYLDSRAGKDLKEERYLWVKDKAALTGNSVKQAVASRDSGALYYSLQITLHKEAGKTMEEISAANISKPLAIVLDGEVISTPNVNAKFGASFMITGSFTEQQARELCAQLENPLKNPLKVENSTFVPAPAAPPKP